MNSLTHSRYKITLHIHPFGKKPIDLKDLCEQITWQTSMDLGRAAMLECVLQKRADDAGFIIPPGSRLVFGVDGRQLFSGIIEEPELSKDGNGEMRYILRAVCHLQLLQGMESIYRPEGMTASDFFMSLYNKFRPRFDAAGVGFVVKEPSAARLSDYYFRAYSLYSMISESMIQTHVDEAPERRYMIRDNAGVIEWRELKALQLPIVLGDNSFLTSYTYTNSIKQTFNAIKALRDNEEIGMRDAWVLENTATQARWWFRQLTWEADEAMTEEEIMDINRLKLRAKNRTTRSLRATGLGDFRIQAGTGVRIRLDRAKIDANHWAEEVTHVLTSDMHTMDLSFKLEGGEP